jgi:hypothetical protein
VNYYLPSQCLIVLDRLRCRLPLAAARWGRRWTCFRARASSTIRIGPRQRPNASVRIAAKACRFAHSLPFFSLTSSNPSPPHFGLLQASFRTATFAGVAEESFTASAILVHGSACFRVSSLSVPVYLLPQTAPLALFLCSSAESAPVN